MNFSVVVNENESINDLLSYFADVLGLLTKQLPVDEKGYFSTRNILRQGESAQLHIDKIEG